MQTEAEYFYDHSSPAVAVWLEIARFGLVFHGLQTPMTLWAFADVRLAASPHHDAFTITNPNQPQAQLLVSNHRFHQALIKQCPQLRYRATTYHWQGFAKSAAIMICGLALALYLFINIAPPYLAGFIPVKWNNDMGDSIEANLVDNAAQCNSHEADAALAIILSRLSEANPDLPPLRLRIYDIAYENAFAINAGRMVITRGLLENASNADDVAGVLAHELGHVYYKHPEAALLREIGMQLLLTTISGDTRSSFAELNAVLQSSREAEEQADQFAGELLVAAHIDPSGLERFFQRALQEEQAHKNGFSTMANNLLSTHPVTGERIEKLRQFKGDHPVTRLLSPRQWQALQQACDD